MKKLFTTLTLTISFIIFSSFTVGDSWSVHSNKKGKFTMKYPSDWVSAKSDKDKKIHYFISDLEEGEYNEIVVVELSKRKSKGLYDMEKLLELVVENLKEQDVEVLGSEVLEIDGRQAYTVNYMSENSKGDPVDVSSTRIFNGKKVVAISLHAEPGTKELDDYKTTYNEMVKSIDFLK